MPLDVVLHLRRSEAASEKDAAAAVVGAAEGETGVLDMLFLSVPIAIAVSILAAVASALPTKHALARAVVGTPANVLLSIMIIVRKLHGD